MSTTRRRDILLAQNPLLDNSELGFPNIKVDGVRQSFSQFGAIHRPHRFPPTLITAIGPGGQQGLFPTTFRLSLLTNTAIICIAIGQSPSVGAPPNVSEDDTGAATDIDSSVTRIAPHPRAFMFNGGTLPNPDGPGSSGARTLIPPTQYVSLELLRERVNFGRTPGKEQFRECAITSAGLSIAQWLPDSSISISVAPCNGSEGPVAIVGGTNTWVSATWQPNGGGEAIYTAFGQTGFYPGTTRTISGLSSPFNLTAVVKRTEDVNGAFTRVIMPMATDPGATWSGSVSFDDPAIPWQSITNMVTYAVDNLIGARDVELIFFCHDHEARNTIKLFSIYDSDSTYRRAKIDALAAAVGAPTPTIIIVPTQKPRGDWHDEKQYAGELSYPGMGAAERWRRGTDSNSVVINPMAAAASNGADITDVHRDAINGYMDWGEYGARVWADKRTAAADATPFHVTRTSFTTAGAPSMQFGSKLVKVPLSHTDGVFDGYGWIADPDATGHGVQVFTNDVTTSQSVDKALSTNGRSVSALTGVSIAAGVLTATLATDGSPYNRQIGFGFKNATNYVTMANNTIHSASWALENVFGTGLIGVLTMHVNGGAHGINPGESAPIFNLEFSTITIGNLPATALPGTAGSTVKIQYDTNPGHYISGGSLIRNGADGLGPVRGLRHTLRRTAERHRSLYSGKVFYDSLLSDLHDIRVYGARPRFKDLVTDIGQ